LHYIPNTNLYIINRTDERALELASCTSATAVAFDNRSEVINDADVIIVATQADEPVLCATDINKKKNLRLLIDLSVPCNIDKDVLNISDVHLIGVDELSKVNDQTLANRQKEIPKVKDQIAISIGLFFQWYNQRSDAKKLKRLKTHLQRINEEEFIEDHSILSIQKTVNGMAKKLKQENRAGCFYLQALNEYISINTN
jgi:glutamyl-tRNA reductase